MTRVIACILFSVVALAPLSTFAMTPSDNLINDQWYLNRIDTFDAWEYTTGSRDIIIAVLDSGVDLVHEDLEENIWVNVDEIPDDGIDNDRNGYVDDAWGYDFVLNEGNPFPVVAATPINPVSALHGTLVSGVIGAMGDNEIGVAGVSWAPQILPVRVLNENGDGRGDIIADGIRYAVDQGASVINLSFSGSGTDSYILGALKYAYEKGVVVVAAAGNEDKNINNEPVFPACAEGEDGSDYVIGVAASDEMDEKAGFSNYGQNCIDISAPGTDFTGLSYFDPAKGFEDPYTYGWSGTSLAAPLVAGSAGLLLSQYPEFSPDNIRLVLQLSTDPVEGDFRSQMGSGRLNIGRAFDKADELWNLLEQERMEEWRFVKLADQSTVYMVMPDGTRRLVLDGQTFKTYTQSFDSVETVSAEELGEYKLKGTVLPRANRTLVKITSDPKVYWLARNGNNPFTPVLRSIPDEETARYLFGSNWQEYVIDIDIALFEKFERGVSVKSDEQLQTQKLIKRIELI